MKSQVSILTNTQSHLCYVDLFNVERSAIHSSVISIFSLLSTISFIRNGNFDRELECIIDKIKNDNNFPAEVKCISFVIAIPRSNKADCKHSLVNSKARIVFTSTMRHSYGASSTQHAFAFDGNEVPVSV